MARYWKDGTEIKYQSALKQWAWVLAGVLVLVGGYALAEEAAAELPYKVIGYEGHLDFAYPTHESQLDEAIFYDAVAVDMGVHHEQDLSFKNAVYELDVFQAGTAAPLGDFQVSGDGGAWQDATDWQPVLNELGEQLWVEVPTESGDFAYAVWRASVSLTGAYNIRIMGSENPTCGAEVARDCRPDLIGVQASSVGAALPMIDCSAPTSGAVSSGFDSVRCGVATFDLPPGEYRVLVRILDPDGELIGRGIGHRVVEQKKIIFFVE